MSGATTGGGASAGVSHVTLSADSATYAGNGNRLGWTTPPGAWWHVYGAFLGGTWAGAGGGAWFLSLGGAVNVTDLFSRTVDVLEVATGAAGPAWTWSTRKFSVPPQTELSVSLYSFTPPTSWAGQWFAVESPFPLISWG